MCPLLLPLSYRYHTNLSIPSQFVQKTTFRIIAGFNQTKSGHFPDQALSMDTPVSITVSAKFLILTLVARSG